MVEPAKNLPSKKELSIASPFNGNASVTQTPAQAALGKLLSQDKNQFLVLGDSDHTGSSIPAFLAQGQTMAVMAQNGVKNLALEVRKEFQPLMDKVAGGQMSPQQYAIEKQKMYESAGVSGLKASQAWVDEARIGQAAGKAGIKILCAEAQEKDLKSHIEMLNNKVNMAGEMYEMAQAGIMSKLPPGLSKEAEARAIIDMYAKGKTGDAELDSDIAEARKAQKDAESYRTGGDKDLAQRIKDTVKDERTVVLYGSGHGAGNNDLDEHLKAKRANLYPNMAELKSGEYTGIVSKEDRAEFSLALDTGTLVDADASAKMLQTQKPGVQTQTAPAR